MPSLTKKAITAAIDAIGPGSYITDGGRLVEVRRVEPERVIGEEGPVDAPDIVSLSWVDVATEWRVLEVPDAP